MAKTKNKKKNSAEIAAKKRLRENKKNINPFEIHINKDKHKILGKKSKADRGLPGVARSKAINKRKNTLLVEFNQKDKDNIFMDKRIGERKSGMTEEEKAMARFAAIKVKTHKKQSIFNLNDDEVLTHRGHTIEEIEKFEDPRSDDEFSDNEDQRGYLDKNFVNEAHFGGGVLSKPDAPLSRKELIDQLIAESKKRKAEKQKTREQTIDLTEKLDTEWKDLLPLMTASNAAPEVPKEKPKIDDYDRAVRELKFESRGNPTDRLKSEEEIMKEEKEKLEALERDRLARMKGLANNKRNKINHKSADDLDDGFDVEEINEEPLAYDEDGQVISTRKKNDDKSDDNEDVDEGIHDNSNDSDEDSDEENTDEVQNKAADEKSLKENGTEQESAEESDDEDDDDDDSLSDLKASESSSEDDEQSLKETATKEEREEEDAEEEEKDKKEKKNSTIKILENKPVHFLTNGKLDDDRLKEVREDLQKQKEIMEKAREELPYTYTAPENFEELKELLENQKPEYQSIIMERIIKCNHWTLGQGNREKLCKVFEYLLQYIIESACVDKIDDLVNYFQICDRLSPHLFDLAQASAENAATCVQKILQQKYETFKKHKKKYPGLDTLILFKLISLLFPTSDFRHPVVTPCLVFMSQILSRCQVKTKTDISKGLFVVTLILEYTTLSKRFSPATINFLRGVIYLATVKSVILPKVIPPFKRSGDHSGLLILEDDQTKSKIDVNNSRMKAEDLIEGDMDDDFRVRTVVTTLNLIDEFKSHLEELEAVYTIFEPILKLLKMNSWLNYPDNIKKHIEKVSESLAVLADKKLEYMVREKKRPKALRLYEPRIERVFDGKKHKPMSKEKAEREKLLHKLKKEKKGAMREIRRDASFLAKVQIKNQIRSDEERKRKVKEIFGEASMQQGELNKIKRKK